MEASGQTRVALVGRESVENLRLADVLRGLVGEKNSSAISRPSTF